MNVAISTYRSLHGVPLDVDNEILRSIVTDGINDESDPYSMVARPSPGIIGTIYPCVNSRIISRADSHLYAKDVRIAPESWTWIGGILFLYC
jgi:hypothetical protein